MQNYIEKYDFLKMWIIAWLCDCYYTHSLIMPKLYIKNHIDIIKRDCYKY